MSFVTVALPAELAARRLGMVVNRFLNDCDGTMPDEVDIDFGKLRFIEPAGVTFLRNFISWLIDRKVDVYFFNHDLNSDPVRFLDDSLFFQQHLGEKLRRSARPRETTKPLVSIESSQGHDWLRSELMPWLKLRLNLTRASLDRFQVCVSEIFNNIKDHSTRSSGVIFCQHFPRKELVNIAVTDFRVGIPAKVREIHPRLDDNRAILKSTEEGFTTKTTPGYAGAGLDYLINTVVVVNGGRVHIYSLFGHVSFSRVSGTVRPNWSRTTGYCPGTTVDIVLRTDTIERLDDGTEELEW